MFTHLEKNKIYVKQAEKNGMIYKLESIETYDGYNWMRLNLVLVSGYDYVNPDYSNKQGYVPAKMFKKEVQDESLICYFLDESIKETLENNDYEIIEYDKLPNDVKYIIENKLNEKEIKKPIIVKIEKIAQEQWEKLKVKEGMTKEDALVCALEYIDEMGHYFDPSNEEYQSMLNSIQ